MSTIEQARSDRARETLNRSIEQQELAQQDLQDANNRGDVARLDAGGLLKKGDGLEGKSAQRGVVVESAATDGAIAHTATGENPFVTLVEVPESAVTAGEVVLADALPLGAEVAPDADQMIKMAALQASGFKQNASGMQAAAGKVRVGTLLLLSDDASTAEEKLGDLKSSADALAATITDTDGDAQAAGKIISQQLTGTAFPAGMDINAYVAQVLREAYTIQQGVLEDYATEMDQINTTRKNMRDRLSKLNALKVKAGTGSATVNDLTDLGVELDPGEVDALGGEGFQWSGQIDLEEAEDQLSALEGEPQTHQSDIKAAKDNAQSQDLVSRLQNMSQPSTAQTLVPASQKALTRSSSGLSSLSSSNQTIPTPGADAPITSSTPGNQKPADAATSEKAQQIKAAQDRVQELMKEKIDAAAANPQTADEVKSFLSDKIDAAITDQKGDLDGADGDAETMQLQLQDATQKSQELMQMMSNMSKVLHDTIMSVIRNIGS